MIADSLSVTKNHFLKKLHKRKNQHRERKRAVVQPKLQKVQTQVAQLRAISDKLALEKTGSDINSKIRQKGQDKQLDRSQMRWKWLTILLLIIIFFSFPIVYYVISLESFTLFRETQNMIVADVSKMPMIQDKLAQKPETLSKSGNLPKRSNSLSANYLSQAYSSLAEEKEQRAFLNVETKVNRLFQPDIKPGPSQLLLLNSYPVAQDRLPLASNDSILPDGLWLKKESVVNQQMTEVVVAVEENLAAEIIATEEPAVVVEEFVANESIEEEPVVQNSYVSPTTGTFRWPTKGPISQGAHRYHMALDIAVPFGTPILAADGGQVEQAGWNNTGYGNLIVIDHQNGYKTYYAHLSSFAVQVGAIVHQGSLIGQVGSTGNSTGPHLHFEVRLNDILQNPFNFLY